MKSVAQLVEKLRSNETLRIVFDAIRKDGPLTRAKLSERVSVSKPTCYGLIDELVKTGAVSEEIVGSGGRRLSPTIRSAQDLCSSIGLDIHMEGIHALMMDSSLRIRAETFLPNTFDPDRLICTDSRDALIARIEEALHRVRVAVASEEAPPAAVCVSASGTIDDREGVYISNPYIPSLHDIPVRSMIRRILPVPVFLARGSNLVTLSEIRHLGPEAAPNLICLSLKRGVGLGIVTGGRLYTGDTGNAGRLSATRMAGWIPGSADTPKPPLADPTVDSLLGLSAILAPLRESPDVLRDEARGQAGHGIAGPTDGGIPEGKADWELRGLLDRYEEGDCRVADGLRTYADRLAAVIADLSLILDVRQVLLAGRYVYCGPRFIEDIRGLVAGRLPRESRQSLDVRKGSLGLRAYTWGAAYMAQELLFYGGGEAT